MITLKEQPRAAVPVLRFLVGEKIVRQRQIAVFDGNSQKVIGHRDSAEQVTVWRLLGFGRTAERAKSMAKAKVGPDFFCVEDMGCSARSEAGNAVVA